MRDYKTPVKAKEWDILYVTADEWENEIKDQSCSNWDGSGYWCKDGKESRDEVFSTPRLDATHVTWYNK